LSVVNDSVSKNPLLSSFEIAHALMKKAEKHFAKLSLWSNQIWR